MLSPSGDYRAIADVVPQMLSSVFEASGTLLVGYAGWPMTRCLLVSSSPSLGL